MMGQLVPLPRPGGLAISVTDAAAEYIRQLIFAGRLRGGARVPQDEIAAALGCSRVPVREALIALEREGWVTIRANRGVYVAELTVGAISDHYELIGFTYGLAARRAVANGPKRLSEQLQEISKGLGNTDDLSPFNEAALAFHAAVVRAAASPRVRAVLRSTSGFVPGNFFSHIPGAAAVERRGTTAIRRAITAGDGERAAEEYLKMLRRHGEMVIDVLNERRYFDLGSSGTLGE